MTERPDCFGIMWDEPAEDACVQCEGKAACFTAFQSYAKTTLGQNNGLAAQTAEVLGVSDASLGKALGLGEALAPMDPAAEPIPQEAVASPPPLPSTPTQATPPPQETLPIPEDDGVTRKVTKKKVTKKKVTKKKVTKKKVTKKKVTKKKVEAQEVAPENPPKGRKAPPKKKKAATSPVQPSLKSCVPRAKVRGSKKKAYAEFVEDLEDVQGLTYRWGVETYARRFKRERSKYQMEAGDVLTREYPKNSGRVHIVTCLKNGYRYNDKKYPLLTEVLADIVGLRETRKVKRDGRRLPGVRMVQSWTIQRFFGLKG